METSILEIAQKIDRIDLYDLSFWGSATSIVGLLGIILNTWRLSKVKRIVEEDRFRVADTIKPFDLYFNLQKTTQILRQQHDSGSPTYEERVRIGELLDGLGEVTKCLRIHFKDVHKIRNVRDNSYVDAGHSYLVRDDPETATEYYEKGWSEAKAHNNKADISECIQGLRVCAALLGDDEYYNQLATIARRLRIKIKPRRKGFRVRIERIALKISFRTQMLIRSKLRFGKCTDASRLVLDFRSYLIEKGSLGSAGAEVKRTEALSEPTARKSSSRHEVI